VYRAPGKPPRRVWKTHTPPHIAPWKGGVPAGVPPTARIIVCSRGPRDQAVSFLHHMKSGQKIFRYDTSDPTHMYTELWGTGRVESGDFYTWYKAWWDAAESMKEQVLWMRFEDMKADAIGSIRKVAAFLNMEVSEEVIMKTAEASSFSSMKQQHEKMEKKSDELGAWSKKGHFRKGESGGWKDALTPEQQEWFAKHDAKRRAETGLSMEAVADS